MIRTYTIYDYAIELSRNLKRAFPILKDRESDFGVLRFMTYSRTGYEEGIKVKAKFGIDYSFTFKNFVLKGKVNYSDENKDNVYLTYEKNSHGYFFINEKVILNQFGKHILSKLTNYQALDEHRKVTKGEQREIDNFSFDEYLEKQELIRQKELDAYYRYRNNNKTFRKYEKLKEN